MSKTGTLKARVLAIMMMLVLSISLVPLPAFAATGGGDTQGGSSIQAAASGLSAQEGETDISGYYAKYDTDWGETGEDLAEKIISGITVKESKKADAALTLNTDYTVKFKNSEGTEVTEVKAQGTYDVVISGAGSYTGTLKKADKINVVPYFRVYLRTGKSDPELKLSLNKTQFDALEENDAAPVSGLYYKGGAWQVTTAKKYVTLEKLVSEAKLDSVWDDDASVVYGGDPNQDKPANQFTKAQLDKLKFYPGAAGSKSETTGDVKAAPLVFALEEFTGKTTDTQDAGEVQTENVSKADGKNAPRSVLGVDPDDYVDDSHSGVTVQGKRLWNNITAITIIDPVDISKAEVALDGTTFEYTGSEITPTVSSVKLEGGATLTSDDYDVSYDKNTAVGTATVNVKGKGFYVGTATAEFTIAPISIDKATVEVADQTYTGKALEPKVTVTLGEQKLVADQDYTVDYANNTEVGKATVTVKGTGNYGGSATGTFEIKEAPAATEEKPAASEEKPAAADAPASTPATPAPATPAPAATETATTTQAPAATETAAAETGLAVGTSETTGTGAKASKVKATSDTEVAYVAPKSKSTKKVTVPATVSVNGKTYKVTSVSANAFKGSKATSITVGSNVTKIGQGAFKNAKQLKKLVLGKKVKSVGKNALKGANKLKTLTVKSSKLTKTSLKNLLKGSKVKTIKLSGVSKKAKNNYKKWAKAYGVTVK